jgi:hypothetical protein
VLVEALEQAATAPAPSRPRTIGASLLRLALTPVVYWPRQPFDKARARARRTNGRKRRSPAKKLARRGRYLVKTIGQLQKRRRRFIKRVKRLKRFKQLPWLILLWALTSDDNPRGRLLRSNMPRPFSEAGYSPIVYPASKKASEKSVSRKKLQSQRRGNA